MGWLILPQLTSFSDECSLTTNLSSGERPVCGAVIATNGPMSANSPSLRRAASLKSSGAIKFQWTLPRGASPCLLSPMLPSRATEVRCGLISVAITSWSSHLSAAEHPSPPLQPCSRYPERQHPAPARVREDSYPPGTVRSWPLRQDDGAACRRYSRR